MRDEEYLTAQFSALMATLQAIIHALPPMLAAQAASNLKQLAPRLDAASIGSSPLPDAALDAQRDTIQFMLDALEQRSKM